MADDKLNRLLGGQGGVEERTRTVKTLSDEELQMAATRCPEAKLEIEFRASARRDAREEETLSIARRANVLAIIAIIVSAITAIVVAN